MKLTGEEVYNKFDPHNQGTLLGSKSFIPPGSNRGATISGMVRKGNGNEDNALG